MPGLPLVHIPSPINHLLHSPRPLTIAMSKTVEIITLERAKGGAQATIIDSDTGVIYTLELTLSESSEPSIWNSLPASIDVKITYDAGADLQGTGTFSVHIENSELKLTLSNGPVLDGKTLVPSSGVEDLTGKFFCRSE
ncbi:hypothetical protein MIND_00927900 [Mycena indigotica]|uniref:Uncharacterized protein n=1 Tax=Mycena indigotica TaxID=2126181 RepID=A0A8H6SCM0_9AGAR|nr:uncharacterized protein MIND_00927900 [Mycena indigotica]KAF7296959.1 hypothetical protein MIND_00927900 [Mycena indigotica]